MKVPFVDLFAQYQSIKSEIDRAISDTIQNSAYIGGESVKRFERAFANYIGVNEVIGCANGTDSLEIILKAWGIGPGDEVIVPAHSWISTSEAVGNVGAKPVFVDTEADYYCINVNLIEAAITSKTKAIIPVHLFGHPADMPAIMKISEIHGLKVLEDCAQAHGATIGGQKVGSFGHASSFSFYPGKNLGAYGDAGCMATNDTDLAEQLRMIANHGQKGKHNHLIEGRNSRLDGLHAAILLTKLAHLETWTEKRISHAKSYHENLRNTPGIILPNQSMDVRHVFHLYVVRVKNRDHVVEELRKVGVETAVHYPTPLPLLKCYSDREFNKIEYQISSTYQNEIISLPMYAEINESQIQFICSSLKKILAEMS